MLKQTPPRREPVGSTHRSRSGRVLLAAWSLLINLLTPVSVVIRGFQLVVTGVFLYTRVRVGRLRVSGVVGVAVGVAMMALAYGVVFQPATATAGPANTVNFQARLETASGAIAGDGFYNVRFKLYSASTGGSALWTESYLVSSSNGIRTANGYLTANLGGTTNFPGSIDWGQQLYLTMEIGGTGSSPTWDGEMSPRLSLTSVPSAFALNSYNSALGFTSSLKVAQPTGGSQTFSVPDQGAAGSYTLLTTNTANNNYIQNQNVSAQATSNFWISGTGKAATSLQAPQFDTPTAVTLGIGTTTATAITIGRSGITTTNAGAFTSTGLVTANGGLTVATGSTFTNSSSTVLTAIPLSLGTSAAIGTNTATVDVATNFNITATAAGLTFTLPTPTANTTAGRLVYVSNVGGTNAFTMYGSIMAPGTTQSFVYNGSAWTTNGSGPSGNYIQNTTIQQAGANFNIAGNGTIGGTLNVTGQSTLGATNITGVVNINTSGTAATNIGNTGAALTINSTGLKVTSGGAATGLTAITSSGTITFSGLSTAGIVTNTAGGILGTVSSVPVANGGTGLTATPTNGQLPIGNGSGYTLATLTQGSNVSITNAAGSITVATTMNPSFTTSVTTPMLTSTGALTVQSAAGQNLNLNTGTAGGTIITNAGTIQRTAAGTTTIDLSNAGATTLTLNNSLAGAATLNLADGGLNTNGVSRLTNAGVLNNITGYTQTSGNSTFTQGAGNQLRVQASAVPTTDQVNITNAGQAVTGNGISGQQIDYYANLSNGAFESGALRVNYTNTSTVAGAITDGLRIVATTNVASNSNGIKVDGVTSGAGVDSAFYVGLGWDNILSYGGTQLISGTGILQSVALSGTYSNSLTFSNASNAFSGVGTNLTALNATNINQGTLADARLSSNVAKYNDTIANFTGSLRQNGSQVCLYSGNCVYGSQITFAGDQYFQHDGNTMGLAQVLGSNDNFSLTFETNNTSRFTIDTSGNANLLGTGNLTINGGGLYTGSTPVLRLTNNGTLQNVTYNGNTVGTAYGGTGLTTFTANSVLYSSSTSAIGQATAAAGRVLLGNASGVPTFTTLTGDVTVTSAGVTAITANSIVNGDLSVGSYANITGVGTLGSLTVSGATTLSALTSAGIVTNTATGVLGTVASIPAANGGTGQSSYTAGDMLYASGAAAIAKLGIGTAGQCLVVSAGLPAWASCTTGAVTTVGTFSTSNTNANGATISGSTITFQSASTSAPGMVDIGTQTFAGNKTFNGTLTASSTLNVTGLATLNGGLTTNLSAGEQLTVIAAATPTADLTTIGNTSGLAPTANGISAQQINWFTQPSAGNVSSAQRIDVTNTNIGAGGQVQGLRIVATGAGANRVSDTVGLFIDGLASNSGGTTSENALEIGSGWDNVLVVNGTNVLNGSGVVQSAALSGTYSNAVTFSNAGNSFTGVGTGLTALNGSNITSGTVATTRGGTGLGSFTANGVFYAPTSSTMGQLTGTSGQVLMANASGVPTFNSLSGDITVNATGVTAITTGVIVNADLAGGSYTGITTVGTLNSLTVLGTTNINTSGTAATTIGNTGAALTINSTGLKVTSGGAATGLTAITSSGTITFSGLSTAGIVTNTAGGVLGTVSSIPVANGGTGLTATPTNGQLPIGNGTGYTLATLTQGSNISITNAAGSITVATTQNPTFTTSVTTPLLTSTGVLNIQSAAGTNLNLNTGTAGGTITTNAGTIQRTAAGTTILDLNNAGTTILDLRNSGSGVANLNLYGGSLTTGSANTIRLTNAGVLNNITGYTQTSGNTTFNQAAGNQLRVQASAAPTADMVVITNAGQATTTANTNALQVAFTGGAAAIEAGAARFDLTPGSTVGGTWNGLRVVAGAAAAGIATNGLKLESTVGASTTQSALYINNGWDTILNYNGTSIISGAGVLTSAGLSGTYTNALTFSSASNSFTGNGANLTALNGSQVTTGTVVDARLSSNVALYNAAVPNFTGTLQNNGNNVCNFSGNCVFGSNVVFAGDRYFEHDGNSMGLNQVLGSNDNFSLTLETNNVGRLTVENGGNVNLLTGDLEVGGTTVLTSGRVLQNVTYNGGTIGVPYGGTGVTSFSTNGILYGNGAGAIGVTSAGTTGQCLIASTGSAPVWGSCAGTGSGSTLQAAYNNGTGGTTPEIVLDAVRTSLDVQAYNGQVADLLDLRAYAASGLGAVRFSVSVAGAVTSASSLTVQSGGANISGGIANNNGGITATGSLQGVTGIAINGSYTQTGTAANTFSGATSVNNTLGVTGLSTLAAVNATGVVNINTSGTAATTIGNTGAALTINSTGLKVTSAGIATGLTGITSSGTITFSGLAAAGIVTNAAGGVLSTVTSVPVARGGTGLTATPTNGQLPIGNGTGYTLATLTQGSNISITNAAGSITVATTQNPTFTTSVTTPLLTSTGVLNIQSANGNALNLNTTSTGAIALGSVSSALTINSTGLKVTSAGAITGVTTLAVSGVITSTVATGTAPLTVASTTLVANLNADMLDGLHASAFAAASGGANYIQAQATTPGTGQNTNFNLGTGVGIGATFNGTTGINTGAVSGTQRIDASGNLVNIGSYSGSGSITSTGGILNIQGTGTNTFAGSLSVAGEITQGGYLVADAATDNLLVNGDFEMGNTSGWTGITTVTTGGYAGNLTSQTTGSSTIESDDYIPVDPTRDVLQLEGFFKKTVTGSPTPGVLYFGYKAYNASKVVIGTAPCGSYCYFAASGATIPADGAWHKYSATTSGEGTVFPNFPVGTKYVRVISLINYGGSANEVTQMDHVTLKRINNAPLFVGNNFNATNMSDQHQRTQLSTDAAGILNIATQSSADVNFQNGGLRIGGTNVITAARVLQNVTADTSIITSGTLGVVRGGTGSATIGAAGTVAFSNGTSYNFTGVGATNQCLLSAGAGTPTWGSCTTGAVTTVGAYSTTNTNANGATISGSTITFQSASASAPGMVDTTTQTFAGNKTFNGSVTSTSTIQGSQLISTVATGTAPLTVASTTLVANLNAQYLNGYTEPQLAENLRANVNLTGGGTTSFDGTNVKWTTRMIVIANGRGANFSTAGYFDITQPTSGTITGVGGATSVTATAAGIPLAAWTALYYVLPIGSSSTSLPANFRVATYTSDLDVPSNWVLLAVRNGDNSVVRMGTGVSLRSGQAATSGALDNAQFNTSVTTPLVTSSGVLNIQSANGNNLNLNTTSTGAIGIGNTSSALTINSTGLKVTSAGIATGLTGITSSGTITFSGLSTAGIVTNAAGGVLSTVTSVPVARGGTGLTATPTNGQLPIGNGTGYTLAGLTQGSNIAITNGAGSITVATLMNPSFTTSVTTPLLTSTGALSVQSAAATALTLDSGTTGAINIGASANAKTITVGNATGATAVNLVVGTGNLQVNGTGILTSARVLSNITGLTVAGTTNLTGITNINVNSSSATNIGTGSGVNNVSIGNLNAGSWSVINGDDVNINASSYVVIGGSNVEIEGSTNIMNDLTVGQAAQFGSTISLSSLGAPTGLTYLCRNSSNQIASCATAGTGAMFVQAGNSFGAIAVLGTNDAFGLNLETSGVTRASFAATGNLTVTGSQNIGGFGIGSASTILDNAAGSTQNVIGFRAGGSGGANLRTDTSGNLVLNAGSSALLYLNNDSGSATQIKGSVAIGSSAAGATFDLQATSLASTSGNGITTARYTMRVIGTNGENTTGTTGQTAGHGYGIVLTAGSGGDAPAGSENGWGGSILLQAGLKGAGAGSSGLDGAIYLNQSGRGSVGINSTLLGPLGTVLFVNGTTIIQSKTFNGQVFTVNNTSGTAVLSVDTNTNITAITGSLTVASGGANITGTLAVTGAATVSSTLAVTGQVLASSHIRVAGGGTGMIYSPDGTYLRIRAGNGTDANVVLQGGQILATNDGSQSAPAYSFSNYTGAGMFMDSNGYLALSRGGVKVMCMNAAQVYIAGAIGDCSPTGAAALRVEALQTDTAVSIALRGSGAGTHISFQNGAGTQIGSITANGSGTVSYNTFTGSHAARIDSGPLLTYGEVATMTGNNDYPDASGEPIYGIIRSAVANDPNVLGAYFGMNSSEQAYDRNKNTHLVAAAGNGDMWIADNGTGNVKIGDPLITSGDVAGHAQRDPKTYAVSHVFAKSAENIDWSTVSTMINGVKVKRVTVLFGFYDSENLVGSVQLQSLNVNNNAMFGGDISVAGKLNVMGEATLGTLKVIGDAVIEGKLTVSGPIEVGTLTVNGHIISRGNAPQISVGEALGTANINQINSAPAAAVDGTDTTGTVSVTAGVNARTTGVLAQLSFAQAYEAGISYKAVLTPTNETATDLRVYIVKTATGFNIMTRDTPAAGVQYQFDYIVLGAQTAQL